MKNQKVKTAPYKLTHAYMRVNIVLWYGGHKYANDFKTDGQTFEEKWFC